MTTRSRNRATVQSINDSINANSIAFYRSDANAVPPNDPRVRITLSDGTQVDHALSEYTSVTGAQKTTLGTIIQSLLTETLTLEGFV